MKAELKVYMRHNTSELKGYKHTKEMLGSTIGWMAQRQENERCV